MPPRRARRPCQAAPASHATLWRGAAFGNGIPGRYCGCSLAPGWLFGCVINSGTVLIPRGEDAILRMFNGRDLVDPGLVLVSRWRPGQMPEPHPAARRRAPVNRARAATARHQRQAQRETEGDGPPNRVPHNRPSLRTGPTAIGQMLHRAALAQRLCECAAKCEDRVPAGRWMGKYMDATTGAASRHAEPGFEDARSMAAQGGRSQS